MANPRTYRIELYRQVGDDDILIDNIEELFEPNDIDQINNQIYNLLNDLLVLSGNIDIVNSKLVVSYEVKQEYLDTPIQIEDIHYHANNQQEIVPLVLKITPIQQGGHRAKRTQRARRNRRSATRRNRNLRR